jgi:hypothetical protein
MMKPEDYKMRSWNFFDERPDSRTDEHFQVSEKVNLKSYRQQNEKKSVLLNYRVMNL